LELDPRLTRFMQRLILLGPGERARLKRNAGASLAEAPDVIGLFYRLVPADVAPYQHSWYFLVATLFPLADAGQQGNFGQSLKRARTAQNHDGLDRRMEILLDADEAQLPFRLRQAVRLLGAQGIAVNWGQLLHDLLYWTHPSRFVQQQWASTYFSE
jgi:CRISPR system Cascade subunit CasB